MPVIQFVSAVSQGSGAGAGGASAPQEGLICQKFGQNLKNFRQRSFDIFNNINEIIIPCY